MANPFTHDFKIKTNSKKFIGELEFNTDSVDSHNYTTYDRTDEKQAAALLSFFKVLSRLFEAFGELDKIKITTKS